jgi:hypothetical protein
MIRQLIAGFLIVLLGTRCFADASSKTPDYKAQADEVMKYIQQNFYEQKTGLYSTSMTKPGVEFMWGNGVIFPALLGACRYEPDVYGPITERFFKAMDHYWDTKAPIPGYEPSPTNGNGHDKYYDDNEWMVITFSEAYEMTHDQRYLDRANAALKFSLSGWDDKLGGGIWWHEGHKGGSKNTCSNAPAAVGCIRMEKWLAGSQSHNDLQAAVKIVDWTSKHLEADDGLFMDNQNVTTEKVAKFKLTYNTALMIRANLGLYRWTGNSKFMQAAKKSARASDWFLDAKTNAYRDELKFSHLMVEADLDLYRATHEDYLLARARNNADHYYAQWKDHQPDSLIDNAALARELWLMADTESEVGKKFWARADSIHR